MQTNIEFTNGLLSENNGAFKELYKAHFEMVRRFVVKNNGNSADSEDIFQDSMLILVQKLRQDNFILTASIQTYIMAIARRQWLKKLRAKSKETPLIEIHNDTFFEEINFSIEQEKTYWEQLQTFLTKITDHCNRLMQDIFFNNKSIEQVQKDYGYSTKHNTQNQKHKCLEQIRKEKEKSEKKEI